jgi:hypothetical protein
MTDRYETFRFYAIAIGFGALLVALAAFTDGRNLWLVAMPFVVPLGFAYVYRNPMLLVAALPFVGIFKTRAAMALSFSDPTFIAVGLCALVVLVEGLLTISGVKKPQLSERFAGQGAAIIAYFAFVVVAGISLFYAEAPSLGYPKLARLVVISTLLFIAPLLLVKKEQDFEQFLKMFVLLSTVAAVKTIFLVFHPDPNVTDITLIDEGQAIGIAILVLVFYDLRGKHRSRILKLCLPLLGAGLLATAARGPIICTCFALLVGTGVRSGFDSRVRKLLIAIPVMAVVAAVAIFWFQRLSTANQRFGEKELEIKTMFSGSVDPAQSAGMRIQYYKTALGSFSRRPFFGWGIGGWAVVQYGYSQGQTDEGAFQTEYPHNIFLEVAVEQGLLGFAALISLLVVLSKTLRRLLRLPGRKYAFLLPVCIYTVLVCMFSNDINNRLLWSILGIMLPLSRLADAGQEAEGGLAMEFDPIFTNPNVHWR